MTPSPSLRITIHDVPNERLVLVAWDAEGREAFRVPLPVTQALDLASGLIHGSLARIGSEAGL